MADPQFRTDLFRGTGHAYERFRLPYPQALIDDLGQRSGADGTGTLLDLACGTGQLAFALHARFGQIWAVDQEPDMIAIVRARARSAGLANFRTDVSAAEELAAPANSFDLIAVGNAFHRFRREAVAANALRWLRPRGSLAVAWGGSPWEGDAPWQQALAELVERWRGRVSASGGGERIPAGYARARAARTDQAILRDAGFEPSGSWEFPLSHDWTSDTIAGFLASTSVLSARALGDLAPEFEDDLRRQLSADASDGRLRQLTSFRYELARRPAG